MTNSGARSCARPQSGPGRERIGGQGVAWRLEQPDPLPTLDQLDGFVADHEAARGGTFDDDKREVLVVAQRWVTTDGARCHHSIDRDGRPLANVSFSLGADAVGKGGYAWILTCGLLGAGKTALARQLAADRNALRRPRLRALGAA